MKFQDLAIGDWFKFKEGERSVQKTSNFGYTDPENKIFGEQQIMFPTVEVIVP